MIEYKKALKQQNKTFLRNGKNYPDNTFRARAGGQPSQPDASQQASGHQQETHLVCKDCGRL